MEIFGREEAVEKLLYLVLAEINGRLGEFAELMMEGYHVPRHNS